MDWTQGLSKDVMPNNPQRRTVKSTVTEPSSRHLVRIDVLRGVAIALVLLFHLLDSNFGTDLPGYRNYLLQLNGVTRSWWLFSPFAFGWVGVSLFFVISGYVIHRSYLLSEGFSWLSFAARRFCRIYPAYFVLLVLFAYYSHTPFVSKDFVYHVFLVHNLSQDTFFGSINGSFWSLAVECQLYALYPLAMIARRRWGWRVMLGISFVVATICLAIAYTSVSLPPENRTIWFSPLALWPTWLIGAAIAEQHIQGQQIFRSSRLWIVFMGALCVASYSVQLTYPLSFIFASFGWAAFLIPIVYGNQKSLDLSESPRSLA